MRTKGWKNVFAFTLKQYIKTKSFIVGTIIMCIITAALCALANILPAAILGDSETPPSGSDKFTYEKVLLVDETGLILDEDISLLGENGITAERSSKSADEVIAQVAAADSAQAAVIFSAKKDANGNISSLSAKTYYSKAGKGGSSMLSAVMTELLRISNVKNVGISLEDYTKTQIPITSTIVEAGQTELNPFASMIHYLVPLVVSFVLFLLIFVYGSTIAQSIATEKTSRVMELLLTSVRPLAIVIGKVLAMGVVSFGQFLLIIIVGAITGAVTAPFGILGQIAPLLSDPSALMSSMPESAAQAGVNLDEFNLAQAINGITEKLTPVNIILVILAFLIGFLFFSLLAALFGASVSRIEDLQAALQPFSLIGAIGFFLAYYPVIFSVETLEAGSAQANGVQIFSYYFPISSPFSLPSAIILGQLDTAQCIIAVAILAAFTVLIAMLVSKVYEAIILHNGSPLKIKDMLKLAKNK